MKYELTSKKGKRESLLFVCCMHNKDIAKRIGDDYSEATLEKYNLTKYHLEQYLPVSCNKSDINLSDVNYRFISGFESF